MSKKVIINKIVQMLFVTSFIVIILLLGTRLLIKGSKDVNYLENRTAYQIPKFSLLSFLEGTYQTDLENAVNDQLWGSEFLKQMNLKYNNFIGSRLLIPFRNDSYYLVTGKLYGYDNADYLLYNPYKEERYDNNIELIKKIAMQYERINLEEKYLYHINNDHSINFENIDNHIYEEMMQYYPSFKTDFFEINSFEDYKNYFYKTDHHWNYKGSYQGYKDIIELMLGSEEEILKPVEEVEFKYYIYGSKANSTQFFDYKEKFSAYRFEMPVFDTYINDIKKTYGNKEKHFANRNLYDDDYNITYGSFYGYDYGKIVYDFKNPEKENLLILGYSDTNAINELVAYHFNYTHVIDLRHIDNFEINQYIVDNEIDKFLFITNPDVYILKEALLEREGS